jgi:hypothetical protein
MSIVRYTSVEAPSEIISVWRRFDRFPMETITKAWFLRHSKCSKQRTVQEMKVHRRRFGASGNCFDLAIWLKDAFRRAGVAAHYIGNELGTPKAHVAVVALDRKGHRYLCDLGDLWIRPMGLDAEVRAQEGLFAGARVSLTLKNKVALLHFLRTNGKRSEQCYDLNPVPERSFLEAANISQRNVRRPLIEMRLFNPGETVHWEFDNYRSFFSSMSGLKEEPVLKSKEAWARRVEANTKIKAGYVAECLSAYEDLLKKQEGG